MKRHLAGLPAACLLAVCTVAVADVQVRIATFNIENFKSSQAQFDAAAAILTRVGADVVCLNEINETADFNDLATAAGYSFKYLANGTGTFDSAHHAGVMSVYPFASVTTQTATTLSGDPNAQDITRNFVVAVIAVPGAAEDLVVVANHWKSGFDDSDEFRRTVESIRAMQATVSYDSNVVPYFVAGDMNDDILDSPDSPSEFYSIPSGMPFDFSLGGDIDFPVDNGIFKPLLAGAGSQDLLVLNPRQLDNSDATRRSSGRRLDYIWYSHAITVLGSQVYDSQDEGLSGGLTLYGSPLPSGTSDTASDHMLVFADIEIPDNQSGACCTACGCDDTLNEGQCLALGGEFRGVGVLCGEEVPPCPDPPTNMRLNEVVIRHDGTQDKEFVELTGDPNELLCGLSILVVEGETLSKGRVDRIIPLDDCGGETCALDGDGYFFVGGIGLSLPDLVLSGTNVFEDGTETFLLVRGFTQNVGYDIDTDNNGVADMGADIGQLIDAVAFVDADYPVSDAVYYNAPIIGPDGSTVPAGAARCPNGADTDTAADWVRISSDLAGAGGFLAASPGAPNPACGGDGNADGDWDLRDFAGFQRCFGVTSPACAAYELDGVSGISLADLELFVDRLTGPIYSAPAK